MLFVLNVETKVIMPKTAHKEEALMLIIIIAHKQDIDLAEQLITSMLMRMTRDMNRGI